MSDAKLERTNVKIEANNHSEILRFFRCVAFEGFLKVYLEGHDDDEEEQEGMLPAMKVSENFTTIILRQRSDIQDLRHAIQKLLWLKN
jgi:DNA topoisomerase IA